MLVAGTSLIHRPVLSLHLGSPVGHTVAPVIDPGQLKIIAFTVSGPEIGGEVGDIMETQSVREYANIGMIIDSTDELVHQADVMRISEVMQLQFDPIGLKVVTKRGSKLGKIIDYTVDTRDFRVMQIVVQRPVLKGLIDPELLIGRSEIIEVDDYSVTVKDEENVLKEKALGEDFVPNFVNPFRERRLSGAVERRLPEAEPKDNITP